MQMRLGGDNEGRSLYAISRLEGNSSKGINILLHDSPKSNRDFGCPLLTNICLVLVSGDGTFFFFFVGGGDYYYLTAQIS